MSVKHKSLTAKVRFALMNDIKDNIRSVPGTPYVEYINGMTDKKLAEKYDVHVTSIARSRRDVFGEFQRGGGGRKTKAKPSAIAEKVADDINYLRNQLTSDLTYLRGQLETVARQVNTIERAVLPPEIDDPSSGHFHDEFKPKIY